MRKIYVLLLAFVLLLLPALPAAADTYSFNSIFMTVEVPVDPYAVQITPDTLAANAEYIASLGETAESMAQRFADEGILLWAYDANKGRTLIITAVQDETAKQLYDINEQTANERASYRANHTNGVYYSKTDYSFESCEWKNFGDNQGRFLMVKYARRQDGKIAYRGLWRRTVRNGYTITIDMRVGARQIAAGDITALNKIQDSISFMQVTSAPDAPLTLGFTAPPPESTNADSFTIKGVTRPGAQVVAAYASLKSSKNQLFTATADGKGAFSIAVKLPAKDLYNLIVSATANEGLETEETISQEFTVDYDPNQLPVSFTSPFPAIFTTDSFKLAGTTATGVTIQLVVNNQLTTKKTGNNRTFSFLVDTAQEGDYEIQLTFSKNGFDTKVMQYTIRREMDDQQREQSARDASISPEYTKLAASPSRYMDRVVRYNGYVVDVRENGSEWIVTFATQKINGTAKNLIIALSDAAVEANPDQQLTMYARANGTYSMLSEEGKELVYPRVSLLFFDQIMK